MYKLTAADFADTGQWRLLLNIGYGGLEAYLENTLHPEIELQELCKVKWQTDNEAKFRNATLCKNIEEAVYNNPRLLDDFATRIVIYDPRTLFLPKELAEESAGSEEQLYKKIYKAETKDIMFDSDMDLTAVWCPAPGVKSFLMRTFPGARITCHLMEKLKEVRKRVREKGIKTGTRFLVKDIRNAEVDFLLMDGENLLSASTHKFTTQNDIYSLEENLRKAYEILNLNESIEL